MADKKISELTGSTTPLVGTETLPIVQSGVTKQVSVSNLTSGRTVSVAGLTDTNLDASKVVFTDADKKLTSTGTFVQANVGTNVAATGPFVNAYSTSNQNFTTNVVTKMTFTTEETDTNNNFSSSTFTPTVAGYYLITTYLSLWTNSGASATALEIKLYKNGSNFAILTSTQTNAFTLNASTMFYANGVDDFFEIYAQSNAADPYKIGGAAYNRVSYCLVRAA